MKIERIRTHHLRCKLPEPFGFSQWTYDTRSALWVEIETGDGLTGWGECYGPAEVNQAAVASFYAPRLIGRDPRDIGRLWQDMWRASLDFARGGPMMAAMSGLDMALWDLNGRAQGRSVSQLLGGRFVESLPCYATGMYFKSIPEADLLAALAREAEGYAEQGFRALKIKVGKNPAFDVALIRAARRALPDMTLMADANHAYDLPEAALVGRALDDCGFAWFEEPLSPEHPELFRELASRISVPLASGECDQTRFGFQRLLAAGGVHIAQPDLAYCGGPSEARAIAAVASSLGVNVIPHVWGTMLNLAAAAHFLAASFREPGRAEPGERWLELDRTPNPLRDELFETPIRVRNGVAEVPSAPGLGVTIDQKAMKSYLVHTTETP